MIYTFSFKEIEKNMNGWKDHMSRDSQLYRRGKFLSPYFRVRQFVVCTFHKLLKKVQEETDGENWDYPFKLCFVWISTKVRRV